jgi:hypothetical protein
MKIILTEKQALIIEVALDVISRMSCGQLTEIITGLDFMRNKNYEFDNKTGYALGRYIEDWLKPKLFPELHRNESYGVGNKIANAQISYEMVKKLQNFRVRNEIRDCGVLKHEPLHYSKEPLIVVEE